MYWHKTKSLLIFVLLIANLFLIYRTYSVERSKGYIAQDYAAEAAQALEAEGVSISVRDIPLKKPTVPILVYERGERMYRELAGRLLGSTDLQETQGDGEITYTAGEAVLIERSDGSFEYSTGNSNDTAATSERRARSLTETFVELAGITKSDFEITQVERQGSGYSVTVQRVFDDVLLSGYKTVINIDNRAVISASGKLITGSAPRMIDTDFSDSVNVLFAIAGSGEKLKIDSMELVYVGSEPESETVFTPMYEISSNGNTFRYDLTTSQIIR